MRQKFIYAFAAAALTAMIVWRVTTGVDLTDESFYLVTARSILEWGAYNVDKSVAQTAPMFDVPFLYLWQAVAGRGADGLIIALRAAFFALCALSSLCLYRYARTRMPVYCATLVSLLPLVWLPYGLPALSYNTLGENFFLIAVLLCCNSKNTDARFFIFKVLSFFLCCFSYPTMTAPVAVFLVLSVGFALDKKQKIEAFKMIVLLALLGAALITVLSFCCGWQNLNESVHFYQLYAKGYSSQKLAWINSQLFQNYFPQLALPAAALGFMTAKNLTKPKVSILLLLTSILLVLAEWLPTSLYIHSNTQICLLAIFLVPVWFKLHNSPLASRLAMVASCMAGAVTAASSANGAIASSIGLFPAICIGVCELYATVRVRKNRAVLRSSDVFVLTIIAVLAHSSLTFIYGENEDALKSRMPTGVFRWLRTTPTKRAFLLELTVDLKKSSDTAKSIYIIGPPGLYFCTNLKPLDTSLFHISGRGFEYVRPIILDTLKKHGLPDVIVQTDDPSFGTPNSVDIDLIKSGTYKRVGQRLHYSVFEKK
jgi:hypothetical protein